MKKAINKVTAIIFLSMFMASKSVQAEIIKYKSVLNISHMEFYSNSGPQNFIWTGGIDEFYVGDKFYLDFSLDFSTSASSNDNFPKGLVSFAIERDEQNIGNFEPSTLTLGNISDVLLEDGINDYDRWRTRISGSSSNMIDQYTFGDLFFEYTDSGSGLTIDTSGDVKELADVFSAGYFDPTEFTSSVFSFYFNDLNSNDNESLIVTGRLSNTQTNYLVSAPASMLLLILFSMGFIFTRRSHNQ